MTALQEEFPHLGEKTHWTEKKKDIPYSLKVIVFGSFSKI